MLEVQEITGHDQMNSNEELCRGCLCTSDNLHSIFTEVNFEQEDGDDGTDECDEFNGTQSNQSPGVTYLTMFEACTAIKVYLLV